MKKFLKSFKRTFYDNYEVQIDITPQVEEPKSDSGKKSETAASVSVTSDLSQNDAELTENEVKITTAQAKKEVEADKRQSYFRRKMTRNSNCRLFLGGFPDDVTEIEVKEAFEKYGKVVDVSIPLDKETNKHKRYGFLEFLNEDSAKACLDDRFVTVNGKRVEVKIAWARGAGTREKSCDKETKKIGDLEKFPSSSKDVDSMTERSLGSSCTDGESNMGDGQVLYQKLFDNYFKAKFYLENLLGSETVDAMSNETFKKQQYDEKELGKILRGLYVSSSEDSCEEEEEDTEDPSNHSEKPSVGELEYYSLCDSVDPVRPDQTEATHLPTKSEEKITCDLCEWAPLDNSIEGFLAHCRTLAHKRKLKERFEKTPEYPQDKASTSENVKEHPRKRNRKKKQNQKNKPVESSSNSQENQKNKTVRKSVVEEILSCVEAKSDKYIKCKICNKTISQAPNIRTLMANVSQHLQSKGHLAKITEINKSLKSPENAEGKNVEGSKTKTRFRCLLCNYFCNKTKTFLVHLTSQSHASNEKQTSVKTSSSQSLCDNLTSCSHCGILLYGSLDIIKNHITKCKCTVNLPK